MAITRNSAEGGTDAVGVTTVNSGADSGTAWDAVTLNGGTIVYDDAQFSHGAMAYLVTPAISTQCELRRNFAVPDTTAMVSFYVRIPSAPTVNSCIAQIRHGSAATGFIQVTTTPAFRFQVAGGSTVHTSATISVDTWYRCEMREVMGTTTSNGVAEFAYYLGDSETPVETAYSSSAVNTGVISTHTAYSNVRYGRASSATTDVTGIWFDSTQELTGGDAATLGVVWPTPTAATGSTRRVWTGAAWE